MATQQHSDSSPTTTQAAARRLALEATYELEQIFSMLSQFAHGTFKTFEEQDLALKVRALAMRADVLNGVLMAYADGNDDSSEWVQESQRAVYGRPLLDDGGNEARTQ